VRAQAWLALKLRRELYGSRSERKARLLEQILQLDTHRHYVFPFTRAGVSSLMTARPFWFSIAATFIVCPSIATTREPSSV
jgi:hypothetical protein